MRVSRDAGRQRATRAVGLLLALVSLTASAHADAFVDIISRNLWVRKGGLACDTAADVADGGSGLFANCLRLPYALRVELVYTPEPADRVYYMRVIGLGDRPLMTWIGHESLTNFPPPGDLAPVK